MTGACKFTENAEKVKREITKKARNFIIKYFYAGKYSKIQK